VVILSGGLWAGAVSEPQASDSRSTRSPASALVLDEGGVDTAASVRFAARLARERGWRRVLVVSHDYHLARVRLLAAREGLVVRTVPATETRGPMMWKCTAISREVLAWAAAWALPGATTEVAWWARARCVQFGDVWDVVPRLLTRCSVAKGQVKVSNNKRRRSGEVREEAGQEASR
jgi:hypothetical protein